MTDELERVIHHCPLCRDEVSSLEFHHWDYENDVGVEICRPCHEAIHGGADGRVSIQQNRAEYHGMGGWHDYALMNLIERDLEYLSLTGWDFPCEPIETPSGVWDEDEEDEYYQNRRSEWEKYKAYLRDRYNLPDDERIEASEVVWGENPASPFDGYLKTGASPMETHGVPEEARRQSL